MFLFTLHGCNRLTPPTKKLMARERKKTQSLTLQTGKEKKDTKVHTKQHPQTNSIPQHRLFSFWRFKQTTIRVAVFCVLFFFNPSIQIFGWESHNKTRVRSMQRRNRQRGSCNSLQPSQLSSELRMLTL